MMYSCSDSNNLFQSAFLTLTYPLTYYTLYHNMSIYHNTLGAIIINVGKYNIIAALVTSLVPIEYALLLVTRTNTHI